MKKHWFKTLVVVWLLVLTVFVYDSYGYARETKEAATKMTEQVGENTSKIVKEAMKETKAKFDEALASYK